MRRRNIKEGKERGSAGVKEGELGQRPIKAVTFV